VFINDVKMEMPCLHGGCFMTDVSSKKYGAFHNVLHDYRRL
jgi:hypothetical protein